VITRCITRSMSVPGATIRVMAGDLERLPGPVSAAAPGPGPAVLAGELLGRVRAELPVVGAHPPRLRCGCGGLARLAGRADRRAGGRAGARGPVIRPAQLSTGRTVGSLSLRLSFQAGREDGAERSPGARQLALPRQAAPDLGKTR
jgi:hypothetical protein